MRKLRKQTEKVFHVHQRSHVPAQQTAGRLPPREQGSLSQQRVRPELGGLLPDGQPQAGVPTRAVQLPRARVCWLPRFAADALQPAVVATPVERHPHHL